MSRLLLTTILAATSAVAYAQNSPEPGVHLSGMVTVVEHPAGGGDPVVTALHANKLGTNVHMGSNLAKSMVYANQSHTVETPGAAASTIFKSTTPTFYVRLDPEDPNDLVDQIALIRLKPTEDTRIVINFTNNVFGSSRKRKVDEVKVIKARLNDSTAKVTPAAPLEPGQYGIVFLPQDKAAFSDRVYDFAIQP